GDPGAPGLRDPALLVCAGNEPGDPLPVRPLQRGGRRGEAVASRAVAPPAERLVSKRRGDLCGRAGRRASLPVARPNAGAAAGAPARIRDVCRSSRRPPNSGRRVAPASGGGLLCLLKRPKSRCAWSFGGPLGRGPALNSTRT